MFERVSGTSADIAGPDLRVLDGIASWCGGLHGSMSLGDALRSLAQGFDADAAAISRFHHPEELPQTVAIFDQSAGDVEGASIRRPLCSDVMGYLFKKARTSTVWFMTDHLDDPNWVTTHTLEHWLATREIREIVVVAIAASLQHQDYIEFHFGRVLAHSERLEIEKLVPTLVRSWAGRKPGLVTQARMDERLARARAAAEIHRLRPQDPILGVSNPARLSRAEFRVCLLLSRGLSVKGVTEELGLSEATVRSHLRSIYSKVEVRGLPELLYRVLSGGVETADRTTALRR